MRKVFTPVLAFLAFVFLWCLHKTLRWRLDGELPPAEEPCIFAFWHGEQQLILPLCKLRELVVMTSRSSDGQLQAGILRRFGLVTVAGSSSRGGAAGLKALVRQVDTGLNAALAVDGPRGPRHESKPGVVQLARLTGAPIIPLRADVSRSWVLKKTWDGFQIPWPFARITVSVGERQEIPRRLGRSEISDVTRALDHELNRDRYSQ